MDLNDGQIPDVRGVRVHVSTGYHPGEGNRRVVAKRPRERISHPKSHVTIRNFVIAVLSQGS
jgi:hypothetical protein